MFVAHVFARCHHATTMPAPFKERNKPRELNHMQMLLLPDLSSSANLDGGALN
jgi:hypothetical protein